MVMLDTYSETDLDQDPVFVLKCGHIFTWGTMDGHLALQEAYDVTTEGELKAGRHLPKRPLIFFCMAVCLSSKSAQTAFWHCAACRRTIASSFS